jgi:hypothetical protein
MIYLQVLPTASSSVNITATSMIDGVFTANISVTPLLTAPTFTFSPTVYYTNQTSNVTLTVTPALGYFDYAGGGDGR